MSVLLASLRKKASDTPERVALKSARAVLSYADLDEAVTEAAQALMSRNIRSLGLFADNGIPWVVADLAAMMATIPVTPMPLFFSSQQIQHVVRDVGFEAILTDQPARLMEALSEADIQVHLIGELCGLQLMVLQPFDGGHPLPQGTLKVTYTSGTTGQPKGVCLGLAHMEQVAIALCEASQAHASDHHLCVTPLATLLENIAGIYVPLLAGASVRLLPLAQVGLTGASRLDVKLMLQAIMTSDASTLILSPQMLQALVVRLELGDCFPRSLRFIAVGGAPVSSELLRRAHDLGLPVYEGYGLSECASVVSLNTSESSRRSSVGQPLWPNSVFVSDEGEICVRDNVFLGYLGKPEATQLWPTGDIGHFDADGFLYVTGRKKSLLITSFGRNVSPEWVECELTAHPDILQAVVFGDAKPFVSAVIVAASNATAQTLALAVAQVNKRLPDYAQVSRFALADTPFSSFNQQLTLNGRPRREVIYSAYASVLESFYQEESHVVF